MSAQRREVTSPPRRVPFESFYDDFPFAAGALAGNGLWVPSPFGFASLNVSPTGGLIGVAGGPAEQTRSTALSLGAANFALPWELSFTVAFNGSGPVAGGECLCQIVLGDDNGPRNALQVYLDDTYATTHKAMVYVMDDRGGAFGGLVSWPLGTRRLVKIIWDGARQRSYVDGVQVTYCVARPPAQITLKDVSLEIAGDDSAAGWTIYDFAMRVRG